jgi:hypothetical protein
MGSLHDVVDAQRRHLGEPAPRRPEEQHHRLAQRRHRHGQPAELLGSQPVRLALGPAAGQRHHPRHVHAQSPVTAHRNGTGGLEEHEQEPTNWP